MPESPVVKTEAQVATAPADRKAGGLSFADYVQIVAGTKDLPESDVDVAAIMAQIMGAESLEAGLGERHAEGLRNHIGETFMIHDFRLNRSDDKYAGGGPVYAAIDATLVKDGERVVLTTGAAKVLAGLGLILKLGQWDEAFTTSTRPTPNGDVIDLIYVPRAGEGDEAF